MGCFDASRKLYAEREGQGKRKSAVAAARWAATIDLRAREKALLSSSLHDCAARRFSLRVRAAGQPRVGGGLLAKSSQFEYRPQQQSMATAVAKTCQARTHLIVEAGTGVGKSLAYLVPSVFHALAENRKALISTHTINLQEQLFYKDIPLVQKLLPTEFKAVLLKGHQDSLPTAAPARDEPWRQAFRLARAGRDEAHLGMEPPHARRHAV